MISIYSIIDSKTKGFLSSDTLDKFKAITTDIVFASNIKLNNTDKNLIEKYDCKLITSLSKKNIDLFNIALDQTNNPIKLCLGLDEYIPIDQKNTWHDLASLLSYDKADSYVIPMFDNKFNYITSKWFIHKNNCAVGCISKRKNCFDLIDKESKKIAFCKILPIDPSIIKEYEYPFVIKINHV